MAKETEVIKHSDFKKGIGQASELFEAVAEKSPQLEDIKQFCLKGYDIISGLGEFSPVIAAMGDYDVRNPQFSNAKVEVWDVLMQYAHPDSFNDIESVGTILNELVIRKEYGMLKSFLANENVIAALKKDRNNLVHMVGSGRNTILHYMIADVMRESSGHDTADWKTFFTVMNLAGNLGKKNDDEESVASHFFALPEGQRIAVFEKVAASPAAVTLNIADRTQIFTDLLIAKKYESASAVLASGAMEPQTLRTVMVEATDPSNNNFDFSDMIKTLCQAGAEIVQIKKDNQTGGEVIYPQFSPIHQAIEAERFDHVSIMLKNGIKYLPGAWLDQAVKGALQTEGDHLFQIQDFNNSPKVNNIIVAKVFYELLQHANVDKTMAFVKQIQTAESNHKGKLTHDGWSTLYKIAKNHLLELEVGARKANFSDPLEGKKDAIDFLQKHRSYMGLSIFKTKSTSIREESNLDRAEKMLDQQEAKVAPKMHFSR